MKTLADKFIGKSHILWDWNGTLLNDVDHCVTTLNQLLAEHGLKPTDRESYRRGFRFPVQNYYQELGFDFAQSPFEDVVLKFVKLYTAGIAQCALYEGAVELLHDLKNQGFSQSVLSAAGETGLHELVNHYQIRHYFDHVYGLAHNNATSKVERGLELLKALNVAPPKVIMIGDTDHDMEVGKAMGIDVLLLADGHQHYDRLTKAHPNVLETRYTLPDRAKLR